MTHSHTVLFTILLILHFYMAWQITKVSVLLTSLVTLLVQGL